MMWNAVLPKWARIAAASLGFIIVAGAFLAPALGMGTDPMLPGISIGAIWAIVGLKGGLPLVPTSGAEDVSSGVRRIRRRAAAMWLCQLCSGLLGVAIVPRTPEQARMTVFFLACIPWLVAFAVWSLSECPRCSKHFYVGRFRFGASLSHCQHCGLGLRHA